MNLRKIPINQQLKPIKIMKKLLFIAAVFGSSFAFTACEEEVIEPQTETKSAIGAAKHDKGQFD